MHIFPKKVEKIEHVSVLIRKFNKELPREARNPLPKLVNEENLEEFLKRTFERVYELSGRTLDERLRHMRKWNVFRIHRYSHLPLRQKSKHPRLIWLLVAFSSTSLHKVGH
ncbi:MAG: Uncharacterized protein XD43_1798 [Thermococcales archaeon 44_46]|nr:MAG: Uncharacterized protein XD43_1798 [Thermococcales archaeon 44_46]HIH73171.1 hypothetical protein [Thermococcaceae archaeon]